LSTGQSEKAKMRIITKFTTGMIIKSANQREYPTFGSTLNPATIQMTAERSTSRTVPPPLARCAAERSSMLDHLYRGRAPRTASVRAFHPPWASVDRG
jgi:hypothetical protein